MVFLDDLLKTADLKAQVNRLCREFRESFSLPPAEQLGLVVPDVEAAAGDLEKRGVAPFFIAEGPVARWRESGRESRFSGKLGLTWHRGLELELLEPGHGSDFYRQSLDPGGAVVLQHLGFLVDDVDQQVERMDARGVSVLIRGSIVTGPLRAEFAYLDTQNETGLVMELITFFFLGVRVRPVPSVIRALGRLEKWSGRRSIRV